MSHRSNLLICIRPLFTLLACLISASVLAAASGPVRVVVWDEREAAQKSAYEGNFLGNTLAAYLAKQPDFQVKSVGLDDPDQGLSDDILDNCDVLIWWGHERHGEVTDAHVKSIIDRLKEGRLSFIALHSAHWSKPFIAAMGVRAVDDALQSVPAAERARVKVVQVPDKGGLTGPKERISPWFDRYKTADGTDTLEVHLPRCVFSKVEAKALPSQIYTWLPKHPIAEGIPGSFEIPHTEIYGGEFSVPKPDAMIFEERWADGSRFTSGCAWQVEKGRVFYFRPGHETYAVFTQEYPLKIVANAVRWARP